MSAWRSLLEWQRDADTVHSVEGAVAIPAGAGILAGRCGLCGSQRGFDVTGAWSEPREGLLCLACRCNARQRAAAGMLLDALAGQASGNTRVYISEQASPLYVALRRRIRHLEGGEFATRWLRRVRMAAWLLRRGVPEWIHRRDVTALDFGDAQLDAVLSLDVLEHVPGYQAALAEFRRVLRPGGILLFTVPFYDGNEHSQTIARAGDDGRVEFFGEAEYHGDPRGGGVPCFHHFGWDVTAALLQAGFSDAALVRAWQPDRGIPRGIWLVRALH